MNIPSNKKHQLATHDMELIADDKGGCNSSSEDLNLKAV